MRPRVYISGPITGDGTRDATSANLYRLEQVGMLVRKLGYAPFVPTTDLRVLDGYANALTHADWLECDYPYIDVADFVLRVSGDSPGADQEVLYAHQHGIRVLHLEDWEPRDDPPWLLVREADGPAFYLPGGLV